MCATNANNPDGAVITDFGPDDPIVDDGTAKDTADKPDEKPVEKSDEKPTGVSTTEPVETKDAEPGPDEGKPESKPDETREDVKISRAYFQEKAQKETEARKALQDEVAAMNADLAASDPSVNFDAGVTFEESKADESAAPATPVADEFAEAPAIDIPKLRKDLVGDVVSVLDTRQAQERQHRIDVAYTKELQTVGDRFTTLVQKLCKPDDKAQNDEVMKIANDAIKYSQRFVTEAALGAPTKRAELAGEYIQREMTRLAVKASRELATKAASEADDEKVKAAQELAQPSGAGIVAPAPNTSESINKEHADDIMPDDPFG